ncbi:MAG TPA: NIPSNAP family protein [Candidatus Acidoferrales bacterium]|jgi:hypothetical protein|nr:NIPSNAP family protein [Candidatus Acidoferrales bacterium]
MTSGIFRKAILAAAIMFTVIASPCRIVAVDLDKPQYYELRVYTTTSVEQRQRVSDYWQNAGVPAYNRMGIQPIGVFSELQDSPTNHIYVVIPYDSLEIFAATPEKLAADTNYQQVAAEYLSVTKASAAYERFESSLLVAFVGMKHLAVPAVKPNIFELRTYLSPSEGKGLNKVRMFNSGEIPLMKEVNLGPIFFGRTLVGTKLPCLTYLLSDDSLEAHKQHWKEFNNSSIWKNLSNDPQYTNNVSAGISIMLKRTPASQI